MSVERVPNARQHAKSIPAERNENIRKRDRSAAEAAASFPTRAQEIAMTDPSWLRAAATMPASSQVPSALSCTDPYVPDQATVDKARQAFTAEAAGDFTQEETTALAGGIDRLLGHNPALAHAFYEHFVLEREQDWSPTLRKLHDRIRREDASSPRAGSVRDEIGRRALGRQ